MTRIVLPVALLATTLALPLPAAATSLTRTFVSAAGSDANPCTIAQPCATFATAYAATAANGIVTALDPGKYGPLTITGPVTVNGNGWAAITAPAGGNGITVNANANDNVVLTGLRIDGAGAGSDGIVFNSGAYFAVSDCELRNFVFDGSNVTTGNGILIQPAAGIEFVITNTTTSNNGFAGIFYRPPGGFINADGVIDHVVATTDLAGIYFNTSLASGGTTVAAVSNSITSNNGANGILANNGPGTLKVAIDNVSAIGNNLGIQANTTTNMMLRRSVITGNNEGVVNATSPNTFYTYKDNLINLNGTDISGTALNASFVLQ